MENIFIKYNEISKRDTANWDHKFLTVIHQFLANEPKDLDEYSAWVYQWKSYEKELVKAIQYFRKMRIDSEGDLAHSYQLSKLQLRPLARRFYEARARNKELYKSKILPEALAEKVAA
jgi:hypothetical protein